MPIPKLLNLGRVFQCSSRHHPAQSVWHYSMLSFRYWSVLSALATVRCWMKERAGGRSDQKIEKRSSGSRGYGGAFDCEACEVWHGINDLGRSVQVQKSRLASTTEGMMSIGEQGFSGHGPSVHTLAKIQTPPICTQLNIDLFNLALIMVFSALLYVNPESQTWS